MDGWDIAVVVVAGYIAVVTLAQLMRQHRDKLVAGLQREVEAEKQRQIDEERESKAEEERQARDNRKKNAA
ncbi:MAG: hypothetical protein IH991_06980 [Planctomycetes bacterium]|nr:hypothetical protein [Planctomycetota bacterium]